MFIVFLPFKFGIYSIWKLSLIPSLYWIPYNLKQNKFLKNNDLSKVFIRQFCISPKYQRKGYGAMFMKWILDKYIKNRYPNSPVVIQCVSNKARSFYLKIGFKEFASFKLKTKYNETGIGSQLIWYHNQQTLKKWMKQLQNDQLFGQIKNEPEMNYIDVKDDFLKNKIFWFITFVIIIPYIIGLYFFYMTFSYFYM